MPRLLFTKWLLWAGAALLLLAMPAVSHASCNHPSPPILASESSTQFAPRVRFVPVSDASTIPQSPKQEPGRPSQLPCVHCGCSLPGLPPVTTVELGDIEAIQLATFHSDDDPWRNAVSLSAPIYAFTPLDAIEHPPRTA